MKHVLILLVISSLFVCATQTSVKAQKTNSQTFGIKGGVNFSNLYVKDGDENKMLTGFNLGFFAKLPVSKTFAIQPELYYTTKGAQTTYNSTFINGTVQYNFNYLEVPLLFVVNITDNFNIHAGPYVSYMLNGKVKNKSNVGSVDFDNKINTEDYNKVDAGIAAGAGVDLGAVSLGARYTYGLTKVGKERTFAGTTYTTPDATNGVMSLYVSFSLGQN
ncbi:MAG: PorT family protein [Mariniphaga sp.]|nr:PorT family protein [Mariniphaga sp.]